MDEGNEARFVEMESGKSGTGKGYVG